MTAAGAAPDGLRDPWVRPALALLLLLTLAVVLLYRAAPRSGADAVARVGATVRPDAFGPRLARARELRSSAASALAAGDTASASARLTEAAAEAQAARRNAADPERVAVATAEWAAATLDRAAILVGAGSTEWWKEDDVRSLNEALALAEGVRGAGVDPRTRARAESIATEARRKLRRGPLEWLPGR